MSSITSGLWRGSVVTKNPAIQHFYTYRINSNTVQINGTSGFSITTNGVNSWALPLNNINSGQNTQTASLGSAAPTATWFDANSEPQMMGASFVPTLFQIRNFDGPACSGGTSAAGSATFFIYNTSLPQWNITTGIVTRSAGPVAWTATSSSYVADYTGIRFTANTNGYANWNQEMIWSASVSGAATQSYTANTGGGTIAASGSQFINETTTTSPGVVATPVRFGLGDGLGVALQVQSYAAGSYNGATLTQFTVDVFGYWLQQF